jgi:hypothetical protein
MNKILKISVLFVSIVALSGCSIGNFSKTNNIPKFNNVSLPNPSSLDISQTKNWLSYTNSDYKFTLKYPGDWKVAETLFTNSKNASIQCVSAKITFSKQNLEAIIFYRSHGLCTVGGERTGLGNTPTSDEGTISLQNTSISYRLFGPMANGGKVDEIIYNDVNHEYFTIDNKLDLLLLANGDNMTTEQIRTINSIFSSIKLPNNITTLPQEKKLFNQYSNN